MKFYGVFRAVLMELYVGWKEAMLTTKKKVYIPGGLKVGIG